MARLFSQPIGDGPQASMDSAGNMTDTEGNPIRGGTFHKTFVAGSGVRKYRLLYNGHSASRAAGLACYYDHTATAYPGITVTQATTGNLCEFAGIHAETVTSGDWGWVLVEGYYPSAVTRKYGSGSNKNMLVGSWLGLGLNGVDDLCTNGAATCEKDTGNRGLVGGYCINMVSMASHSDQSTTTTTQAVMVYGMVRG